MGYKNAVVLFSGGLDSTTLLYFLRSEGTTVHALSILYGQRHWREIEASKDVCRKLGVKHTITDISTIKSLFGSNALTDDAAQVPHGHYTDQSMKQTVVPNRNMIFLSLAGALACAQGYESVSYAAHAGDHAIYPDCRADFVTAMAQALSFCDWNPPVLTTPFVSKTKSEIVRAGVLIGVPYELTWSCYEGGDLHCGKCGTCIERKEAFAEANVVDPTRYAS